MIKENITKTLKGEHIVAWMTGKKCWNDNGKI